VGPNAWTDLPTINVAVGVRGDEVVEWVVERMTR
jgi:hypothetical protein